MSGYSDNGRFPNPNFAEFQNSDNSAPKTDWVLTCCYRALSAASMGGTPWITTSILAPLPGRFASTRLVERRDPFAELPKISWRGPTGIVTTPPPRSFLPRLTACHDADGVLLASWDADRWRI
ncbi:MAG: hypothetical protein EON58_06350 [Alphaproteobacteria bacterium]|nr:MAG: hypothetical protein EON58_06350 [Alphaproteobacteria bacterium]